MSKFKFKTNTGTERKPVPTGMHLAVCHCVIDLGTQFNTMYGTYANKIYLGFEIPGQRIEIDGKDLPCGLHVEETASLGKKANLRKHFTSWFGREPSADEIKEFDPEVFLGKACNVNVVHTAGKGKNEGRTFANIDTIVPLMAGQVAPQLENKPYLFAMADHVIGSALPDEIPGFVQDKILASQEYEEYRGQGNSANQGQYSEPVSTPGNQLTENQEANLESPEGESGEEDKPQF